MEPRMVKPTATQTAYEDRVRMVELRQQGWTYRAIAERIGCSVWTVMRWVKAFQRGGWKALAYKSCAPKTPHPLTTPETVRQRIRAIKQAHPKWGARLIRRQLELEGVAPVPSEVTIHKIL
ncbi:MAG: helix-turn-helix domain-containing protein, partial [Thermoflexus sp.]